jgi:hypothetical protein
MPETQTRALDETQASSRELMGAPAYSRLPELAREHHVCTMLLVLAVIQLLVFGPIVNGVGFYLDDWHAINLMKQGPRDLLGLCQYYFFIEPKIVNRPLEILHFGSMFLLFGTRPLWYHIVNGVFEVAGALLFYRCLWKLLDSRLIASVASLLFLLCPIHDSTHYWMVSSSVSLSLVLYFASLESTLNFAASGARNRWWWLLQSAAWFGLSLFNYEVFLPLLLCNGLAAFCIVKRLYPADLKRAIVSGMQASGALVVAVAVYVGYLRWLSLVMPKSWLHPVSIDLANIIKTMLTGSWLALGPDAIVLGVKLGLGPGFHPNASEIFRIILVAVIAGGAVVLNRSCAARLSNRGMWSLIVATLVMTAASYSIFGLNPEYTPTLVTMVNRINSGGALGAALLLAVMVAATIRYWPSKRFATAFAAAVAGMVAACYAVTDTAMSRSWVISQTMQRHVVKFVKAHRNEIQAAGCLMLVDCPRYVYWAPVFDGTWDFQSAVRVALNDPTISAGVVSERLVASSDAVEDISRGFPCGKFNTANMLLLDAPHSRLISVHSTADFISAVKTYGMGFDLDRQAPERWRNELAMTGSSKIISH